MSWPQCPECCADTKCFDSRPTHQNGGEFAGVRRRYECLGVAKHRWTTLEMLATREAPIADRPLQIGDAIKTYREWAYEAGITVTLLYRRINHQGVPPGEALSKRRISKSPLHLVGIDR